MSEKIWLRSEFEIHVCLTCEMTWAMPIEYVDLRRDDHKSFRCPNGHGQHYPQMSDKEKLRQQVKHCQADATFWEESYDDQAERLQTVRRSRGAYKGQITQMKKATHPENGAA